jgi:hypothetical protein
MASRFQPLCNRDTGAILQHLGALVEGLNLSPVGQTYILSFGVYRGTEDLVPHLVVALFPVRTLKGRLRSLYVWRFWQLCSLLLK